MHGNMHISVIFVTNVSLTVYFNMYQFKLFYYRMHYKSIAKSNKKLLINIEKVAAMLSLTGITAAPSSLSRSYDRPNNLLHVFGPTIPSASRPFALWNAITAFFVF